MNCERSEELLHDLLDRRLLQAEEAELRVHLAACARCAGQLRELEELLAATRGLEEPPLPEGFADSVMAAVRKEEITSVSRGAEISGSARRNRFRLVSLGAVGSIAAGFLLFVVLQSQQELPRPAEGVDAEQQLAKRSEEAQQKLGLARDEAQSTANAPASEAAPELSSRLTTLADKDGIADSVTHESRMDSKSRTLESDRRLGEANTLHFFARAETPQAELQLRVSTESFSNKNLFTKDAPAEKAKQEKEESKNESVAMGIVASEPVVRVKVRRADLAKLQESWKKIPGLQILESDAGKKAGKSSLGRSASAAEPAPAPTRAKEQEAPSAGAKALQSPESYKGPSAPAPANGEEIVEIVITFLPPEPAAKPK